MVKTSVRVSFEAPGKDNVMRKFSRTVNYVNANAANEDLKKFGDMFTAFLGKAVNKVQKISVTDL